MHFKLMHFKLKPLVNSDLLACMFPIRYTPSTGPNPRPPKAGRRASRLASSQIPWLQRQHLASPFCPPFGERWALACSSSKGMLRTQPGVLHLSPLTLGGYEATDPCQYFLFEQAKSTTSAGKKKKMFCPPLASVHPCFNKQCPTHVDVVPGRLQQPSDGMRIC